MSEIKAILSGENFEKELNDADWLLLLEKRLRAVNAGSTIQYAAVNLERLGELERDAARIAELETRCLRSAGVIAEQQSRIASLEARLAQIESADGPGWLPDNGAFLIRYDDADREDELFCEFGARDAALKRYEQISDSWNAHLFVKIDSNSRDATTPNAMPPASQLPFQSRVNQWMQACFGPKISADTMERNHRFLEEALELVQACGCSQSEAHQLVDYVFGRPVGEKQQEVGGAMLTLAALCLAQGLDMHTAGEAELTRVWTMIDAIRTKQAAKPKHSPLPAELEPNCAHVQLARRILLNLGIAMSPSSEPGADERVDRLAAMLHKSESSP